MKCTHRFIYVFIFLFPFLANAQNITTIAGGGTGGLGDGGVATNATIGYTGGIAVDEIGNVYIADANNQRLRKVNATTGIITTIAGTGVGGYNGDGIPATNAELNFPDAVSVDSIGNVYITDDNNFRIRKINYSSGIISTVAGNGTYGYSGDGGQATSSEIMGGATTIDKHGNIYIATMYRIRKVDNSGVISTIAGTGIGGCVTDSSIASTSSISDAFICNDGMGNVYFTTADSCVSVQKINLTMNIITRFAGVSSHVGVPYTGDGLQATSSQIYPFGIAFDNSGNLFIADYENHRVEKVDAFGIISTVAGTGINGYSGDDSLAINAKLSYPENVALDNCGNLYIDDYNNLRIRKVTFNPSCTDSVALTVANHYLHTDICIYPNPADDKLYIKAARKVSSITICNLIGQTVLYRKCEKEQEEMNITKLPHGIYTVKTICDDGSMVVSKIIKQ